jgi:succinate dehydrogenase flavin-adding protein (antitoxin of CptAB toxin-antitoxin module)
VLNHGRGLAERNWTGARSRVTLEEYKDFLEMLSGDDWQVVEWVDGRHHKQGRQLTARGRETLRGWLATPLPDA